MKHRYITFHCDHCGKAFQGRVDNTRIKRFCGRRCSGIASRIDTAVPWQERFWNFVPDPRPEGDACWVWTGYHRPPWGYGILPRNILAHRASYFLHFEELPPEIKVCHTCDNPPCVNPAHLFEGTLADNNKDKTAKGRNVAPAGEHNGMTRISTADVLAIRELAATDVTYAEVARRFGTTPVQVSRIVRGISRRDG